VVRGEIDAVDHPTHGRTALIPSTGRGLETWHEDKGPCHWLSLPGRCAVAGRLEAPFLTGGGLNPLQTT